MDLVTDQFTVWLKELLIEGILFFLGGLFDEVNTQVGNIASQVGQTPSGWHSGVFSMIRNLSETVIVPIAGLILAFVLTYELIQMVIDRNNLQEVDTWMFFKWIFKSAIAIAIVTNTFNIVMAIFDIAQHVVHSSAGVIIGNTNLSSAALVSNLQTDLEQMDAAVLFGLFLESFIVSLSMKVISLCIMVVIFGRMIEIYLTTSLGPIPLATLANRDWSQVGQNYLRSLLALGFQGFLILVCVGIYAVLVQSISISNNIHIAIWTCLGYTVLLCFSLFKTGSMAKSIFNSH